MKLRKGDLLVVEWLDAYGETHLAWIDDDELDLKGRYHVSSSGFYVGQTKEYLIIAGDTGPGASGRVFRVPFGCIEKVRKVVVK